MALIARPSCDGAISDIRLKQERRKTMQIRGGRIGYQQYILPSQSHEFRGVYSVQNQTFHYSRRITAEACNELAMPNSAS